MAAVTSLGIQTPAAISYLVVENALPTEAAEDPSQWQKVDCTTRNGASVEEQLFVTDYSVIWTRGGILQRVFCFEAEKEKVIQATFARFPGHVGATSSIPISQSELVAKTSGAAAADGPASGVGQAPGRSPGIEAGHKQITAESSTADRSVESRSKQEWAIVVLLTTQAHAFFLGGKSHIVHLPFEVDKMFSLPEGILLRRRSSSIDEQWESSPQSRRPPDPPPNSFALSQHGCQSYATAPGLQSPHTEERSPISAMLKTIFQRSSRPRASNQHCLFSLTDPLNHLGGVDISRAKTEHTLNRSFTNVSDSLSFDDDLLYVSSQDELGKPNGSASGSSPFTLAVTLNKLTDAVTIWQVKRRTLVDDSVRRRQAASTANGPFSRRRSSRGPGTGAGTGATTPVQRGVSIRESFGATRGRAAEESLLPVSDHFSLSLDAAFGSPIHPTRSSRRVSSILARSELSSSQDNATFSEIVGVSSVDQHARRGPSFGADPTRPSFGRDTALGVSRLRFRRGVRASIESQSQCGHDSDEELDDADRPDPLNAFDALDIGGAARGLRQEYGMTEIYTTKLAPDSDRSFIAKPSSERLAIFTIRPPKACLRDDEQDYSVYVCLTDRLAHTFLSLRIQTKIPPSAPIKPSQRIAYNDGLGYVARVTNIARLKGVVDACKVQDSDFTRVLVLDEGGEGKGTFCLHAPWSAPHEIALPARLNVNDPTKISLGSSPRQKRDGGLKRILSQRPEALSAVFQVDRQSKVDVVDAQGVRHRLHIQLRPSNPLVGKIISACDAVLPLAGERREMMLSAWWAAVSWLQSRPETEHEIEWTALVIVLFSIPAGSIQTGHAQPTSRTKRRKTGLLRSSSGANTDLTSWEAMLDQEAGHSGPSPSWMQDPAWQWIAGKRASIRSPRASRRTTVSEPRGMPAPKKSAYILHCSALARDILQSASENVKSPSKLTMISFLASQDRESRGAITANLLVGLHLLREELKLDATAAQSAHSMTPVLAQLGGWLGWDSWSFKGLTYYSLESADMEGWLFDESTMGGKGASVKQPFEPPSILHHIEKVLKGSTTRPFMSLLDLIVQPKRLTSHSTASTGQEERMQELTPRTVTIVKLCTAACSHKTEFLADEIISSKLDFSILETMPEGLATSIRSSMSQAQIAPSANWKNDILGMGCPDDLLRLGQVRTQGQQMTKPLCTTTTNTIRDVHTICASAVEVDTIGAYDGSAEADRQSITRMIFRDDQRFVEASRLLHPLTALSARCIPEPAWSDTELLEAQQELVKTIAIRTLSVSPGRALLSYSARSPLLTEKFPIHGFTLSCVMKPSNTTVTADRNAYTEEKVSWAFFHAGVEAGLSISRDAKGITTSWLHFNKPHELKNRHAGFLLALGLNGHMKGIAKWASYKYLQPKHAMTSIGFLLGCSASYLGSMDLNLTRLLSVHIRQMLPAGAAELNLSPVTQTASIMGIGLLYYKTQHRRMSEVMLSEIENMDQEENTSPAEDLRNEGYRLAAGFALGYINLGRGADLKGLQDMRIVERLLVLAVGTKKADLVHVLDKATAAATVAIALIFMKTGDATLARKIDVPDTAHQFDYVRPDILLLRTVARHMIMWDQIRPTAAWMHEQLLPAFQSMRQRGIRSVSSQELPYMNVLAGLCLSLGLRYAGTGVLEVRDLLCHQLDQFIWMRRLLKTNYDQRLTRITARNCQDTVALSAACVMAGTGDLQVFRRLRALHGRSDAETPYGSHLAAHLAIGILFLGGGTHSFGTSSIAVASLLCAFYPLFPTTVLDNTSHLQAFRHFWVFATEPRCLVIRNIDTHRPLSIPVVIQVRVDDGHTIDLPMTAPCLLPELETIVTIETVDPAYWLVFLDFGKEPRYLSAFKRHQTIYVRRRAAGDPDGSVFSATLLALNDAQAAGQPSRQVFEWIFTLPVFERFDRTERALVLPPDLASVMYRAARGTAVDDCLVLTTGCVGSGRSERLWNLRLLFAWADAPSTGSGKWRWLREDIVRALRANLCLILASEPE
ncbi:MAG: hypothetical protein LQ346_003046 [Caloplaca aetnensis]|nr:MAG: hypothetical protein LQ346_003046 [Caloplaca aetnensis]